LFAGDLEDEQIHFTGCSGGVCVSTVEPGGVARAEFSTDVTFSQWFCFLINACPSLPSLLCLLERNTALQPKIQGNLGDLYVQNDVSVSKLQFRFKVFIPRIPSVFRYRGKSLALCVCVCACVCVRVVCIFVRLFEEHREHRPADRIGWCFIIRMAALRIENIWQRKI